MVRFQGSYTVTDSNLATPQNKRITLDTTSGGIANHHLNVGDHVYLNVTGGNPKRTMASSSWNRSGFEHLHRAHHRHLQRWR
jgi:hypothetical protein